MISDFMKFRLLWWKNWTIQFKYKKQWIFELVLPIIISLILIVVRKSYDIDHHEEYRFEASNTNCEPTEFHSKLNFNYFVAYSPSNNSALAKIVDEVVEDLNLQLSHKKFKAVEQDNATALNEYLELENPFVGIEFKDELKNSNQLPKKLSYILRFRHSGSFLNWRTNEIQNIERFSKNFHSNNIYQDRCFLMIQSSIDKAFITDVSNTTNLPDVELQKYAEAEFFESLSYQTMIYVLPLMLIINFTFAVDNIITNIALEREKNMKIFLKVLGLTKSLQWRAWFAKVFCSNLYSITIYSLLLTSFFSGAPTSHLFYHSNSFLIWMFLIFYLVAMIAFSFFISLFFKKAKIASAVGIIIFISSYLPYNIATVGEVTYSDGYSMMPHFLLSLMSNTGLGFGFNTIFALEWKGKGLLWSTLFSRVNNYGLSVGEVMTAFLLSSLIFMFLIAHLEQVFPEFMKPKKWYAPLLSYFKQTVGDSSYETLEEAIQPSMVNNYYFERESSNDQVNIKVVGLTKVFKRKKRVVDCINITIYENQITVFLGHNGAGKTTLLSLLCGVFPPNKGTAYVLGRDVRHDMNSIREFLGVSFQNPTLFESLTVLENIRFFCQLRGVSLPEISREVQKFVDALDLKDVMNFQIKGLKHHIKRKLSVATALCGNPKIVLLDEPTSGLDLKDKQRVWDLLTKEKQNKSIILTTYSADEASMIGDNVAVIIDGELRALGSPGFLRKQLGIGYRLVCVKKDKCVPDHIIELLKNFVPDVEMESEKEYEITFVLNESYLSKFPEMFDCLENEFYSLRISSFRISLTSLDDAMCKLESVKSNSPDHQPTTSSGSNYFGLNDEVPIINSFDTDNQSSVQLLSGPSLLVNHVLAITKRKYYYLRRNYKALLTNILVTILLLILLLFAPEKSEPIHPYLPITLSNYSKTNVYMQSDNSSVANYYRKLVENSQNIIEVPLSSDLDDYIIHNGSNYVVGATFQNSSVKGWFNKDFFHSAPLSFNLISQAFLKSSSGPEYDISVGNKPFLYSDERNYSFERLFQSTDNSPLALIMSVTYIYWIMSFVTPYVKETTSGARSLLFISGVSKIMYWSICYLIDLVIFTIISIIMIITVMMFHAKFFMLGLTNFSMTSIFFAFSALPMMYLISIASKEAFNAKMNLILIALFTGIVPFVIGMVLAPIISKPFFIQLLHAISQLSPYFVFFDVISHFRFGNDDEFVGFYCEILSITNCNKEKVCETIGRACDYSHFEQVVRNKVPIFLLTGLFYFLLLLGREYKVFGKKSKKSDSFLTNEVPNSQTDPDVRTEYDKVTSMPAAEVAEHCMVIKHMSGPHIVQNVSLAIEENTCVGFLGNKNSGNSLLLKILAGEELITEGDVYVKNHTLKLNRKLLMKKIGYCPPKDSFYKYLTGRENLEVFGLIRGISRKNVQKELRSIADDIKLTEFLDKPARDYSGGTRRKLSTAIALLGDPQIILLDSVLSELDAASKKKLINHINKLKYDGRSIILCEVDFKDCEQVCSKVAVMVEGTIKHLGTPRHLKTRFSKGINLNIKLKPQECIERSVLLVSLKDYMERSFPIINSCTEYMNDLTYNIDHNELRWSEILSTLEDLKEKFAVESYSITESSLEQISHLNSRHF